MGMSIRLLVVGIGLLSLSQTALIAVDKPLEPAGLPDLERHYFGGSYRYRLTRAVTCTFKRTDPSSRTFEVHWLAHWPPPKGEKEAKPLGEYDKHWYKYKGPMTLHEDGTVTGKANGRTVNGSWTGTYPNVTLDLVYGKDKNDSEKSVSLSPRKAPATRGFLLGEIVELDWNGGLARVTGLWLDKTGKPLSGQDLDVPVTRTVVLLPETMLQLGRHPVSLRFLQVGQKLHVAGLKNEEGILAMRLSQPEPELHTGVIVAMRSEAGMLTAETRPRSDSRAELVQRDIGLAFLTSIKPASGRAADLAAAIATLAPGQRIEVSCVDRGGQLQAIVLQARRPRQ